MIECIHFNTNLQQVDLLKFSTAKYDPHIFDYKPFTITASPNTVQIGDFITFINERKPLFTGYVTEVQDNTKDVIINGYDIKYLLDGMQYNVLAGTQPVDTINFNANNTDIVSNIYKRVLGVSSLNYRIINNVKTPMLYTGQARLKSCYEVVRDICSRTQIHTYLYLVASGVAVLHVEPIRDMRNIVLPVNVTHNQLHSKDALAYNQIIGLGSGEGSERDFVFIDNSNGARPRCYRYDLREDITHDELNQRTIAKLNELQLGREYAIELIDNNVYKFGTDYNIGDYVGFRTLDNTIVKDLISQYSVSIQNGQLANSFQTITGLQKGTLTEKISAIVEGGYI